MRLRQREKVLAIVAANQRIKLCSRSHFQVDKAMIIFMILFFCFSVFIFDCRLKFFWVQ